MALLIVVLLGMCFWCAVWLFGYRMGFYEAQARCQREIKNKDAVIDHWEHCCARQLEEIKAS